MKKSALDSDYGSKLRRKAYRSRGPIDHNAAINSVLYRKDSRRKISATGGFKLYAFPSFDRSDALLFLPTAFAGYFNSADSPAISKLLFSHVTKSCAVNVNVLADENINTKSFLRFHEVMSEVFPDIIMCVTATKVVENQIRANMVMKFTACKPVYESVGRSLTGTVFEQMFGSCRTTSIRRSITREEIPEDERVRFFEIADTDLDLVLNTRCEMILTVDDLTKKVTHLTIRGRLTSMEAVVSDTANSAVCEQ